MKRTHFPIAVMMGVVLFVGVGLAAIKIASPLWASGVFTLAVALIGFAILGAIARRGPSRLPWIGFALFGSFALLFSFRPTDRLDEPPAPAFLFSEWVVGSVNDRIDPARNRFTIMVQSRLGGFFPDEMYETYFPSRQVGRSILSILFALLGAFLASLARPRNRDEPPA